MALDTSTDVEEIRSVQDEQGNVQAAANEAMQKAVKAAIEALDDQNATKQDAIEAAVQAVEADVESVDQSVQAVETDVETVAAQTGNQSGLTDDRHATSSTSAEQLPSYSVPDGISVLVLADPNNADTIYLGSSGSQNTPLEPGKGVSLSVKDTGTLYVNANTSGDAVSLLFEGGA